MQDNKLFDADVTDQELVERWQNGDTGAFDELYNRHSQTIFRLGWAMLQQRQAAEDVVQETFLRAHKACQRFDPTRASFGTWLYQIALNYCRSYLRKKRLATIPFLLRTGEPPEIPFSGLGPEGKVLRGEYRRLLWEAVQKLSAPLKEVVTLHYYMEFPAVEIAVMLNCPEGTIYSRLHNARKRLAKTLASQGVAAPDILEIQNAH